MGRLAPSLVVSALIAAAALDASQQPETRQLPVFRANTRLVVTTVSVKDRDGKAIEGLTAKDFVVTEDNQPQEIAFVEYQRLDGLTPLPPLSSVQSVGDTPPAPATVSQDVSRLVETGIAAPPPGDDRFRNRRLIVLYFDLSATPQEDQLRAYDAAQKYLGSQMTAADLVAVMTFSGGAVRVKQDFTDNRAKLREVIDLLIYGEDKDGDGQRDPEDPSSLFGQNDAEFNLFSTDRQLSALQTAASWLRPLPEQKSLVLFTSNLRLNGTDNNAQLRATTNEAIRANVQIFPVDAKGLTAMAPLGNANQRSPGGIGVFTGALAQQAISRASRAQDTLYALAKDTGGTALFDYNDLSLGIRQAAEAQTSYYIVGFYSTHTANDGKFRRVQVRLANADLRAELSSRPGYFADKEWAKKSTADRERQIEEALMLENPITDITIALELNYFQLNRAEYFVPVAVKIPGAELELAQRRGARRMTLETLVEVKDEYGRTEQNIRDLLNIPLTNENAERLATRPVQYETGFTLLPGKYSLKFLARDAESGRIGTYQTSLAIPNLNLEERRLPISSVVLASQRVPAAEALFSVKTTEKQSVGHPLIHDGQKLLPSVTRVFSASGELYVYLEAYQQYAATTHPVVVYATFSREGVTAFETQPVAATVGIGRTSKPIPVRFSIPLKELPPGRYDLQLTALEPTGGRVNFWEVPIAIVPASSK